MDEQSHGPSQSRRSRFFGFGIGLGAFAAIALLVVLPVYIYFFCHFVVPSDHMAILIRKTGMDIENGQEVAPTPEHKGLVKEPLTEGRHFLNPWTYDWEVVPQVQIPQNKIGVVVRLFGDDPPYGSLLATKDTEKGILPGVLTQGGRHAMNAKVLSGTDRWTDSYAYHIKLVDPITVPAGYKGVVTLLSAPLPDDPNVLLVEDGTRGVQQKTLDPEKYPWNPYEKRIDLIDCRSQRFNLSVGGEMGFPSKDGFWVTLDGVIEFRVKPSEAARVFVTYNDKTNDKDGDVAVDEEIISKVILPNARSFCRLQGSNYSGKDFISGSTRKEFQKQFQDAMKITCDSQGIEIIHALITKINPPAQIADPVKQRQLAVQQEEEYQSKILQQQSEQGLATEKQLVLQKQALVDAERDVIKVTTEAERRQEVAVIEANQRLAVMKLELEAATDEAAAILAAGKAAADVIDFQNQAEAAGWKTSVKAFDGDGGEYARWVLHKKLAPAFRRMMVNTADSPIMDIFKSFQSTDEQPAHAAGSTPPN